MASLFGVWLGSRQLYLDWTKASNEFLAGVRTELGIRD